MCMHTAAVLRMCVHTVAVLRMCTHTVAVLRLCIHTVAALRMCIHTIAVLRMCIHTVTILRMCIHTVTIRRMCIHTVTIRRMCIHTAAVLLTRHMFRPARLYNKLLIGRCFWGFVLPVLEYCSAVWCSAADTYLKLLDRVVSDACFTAGGVLNCDLSHRRSVAVLCMLYKIRCNPKHPLFRRSTCALCASPGYMLCFDRTSVYLCASPLQNLAVPQNFYSLSFSLWNDLVDPLFDGVGLAGFKSWSNAFLLA